MRKHLTGVADPQICKRTWGGAPMRQMRFFIGASEFEGDWKGGVRAIILHGRFTGKLSCLRTCRLYPRNIYLAAVKEG